MGKLSSRKLWVALIGIVVTVVLACYRAIDWDHAIEAIKFFTGIYLWAEAVVDAVGRIGGAGSTPSGK